MQEMSHERGYSLQLGRKCYQNGWPMDMVFEKIDGSGKRKVIYFMLQEEMCLNLLTDVEQPLAI